MLTGLCPSGYLTTGTAKVTYIQGVCGDQLSGLPAIPPGFGSCGNHFYYRFETCTDAANSQTDGTLLSERGWGKWRICFDSSVTPTGDCSGVTPVGSVISSGSAITFGREQSGNEPRTETAENRRDTQAPFRFPTPTSPFRNMNFRIGVGHYTSNLSTSACGAGCGFEGCLTKLK